MGGSHTDTSQHLRQRSTKPSEFDCIWLKSAVWRIVTVCLSGVRVSLCISHQIIYISLQKYVHLHSPRKNSVFTPPVCRPVTCFRSAAVIYCTATLVQCLCSVCVCVCRPFSGWILLWIIYLFPSFPQYRYAAQLHGILLKSYKF